MVGMMEGNGGGSLNSYYQQHHHHHHHHHTATTSAINGVFSNPNNSATNASSSTPYSSDVTHLVFSHSHTARAPPTAATSSLPEVVGRKRGRPRKYGPGTESSPPAANNLSPSSSAQKKEPNSAKKAQMVALGSAGQGFTPHVITVSAGEDVSKKIMSFMQQCKSAVCILSANGSISNATLRQPAMLGGCVTYEGRFEILSLSGSFLHSEVGGASSRTGGFSICLSSADGRIVGGGVGGPLVAASLVQVIIGSFVLDGKKDFGKVGKDDATAGKLPTSPIIGTMVSPANFRSVVDSAEISARGNEDHQNMGGSSFLLQPCTLHEIPSRSPDWRGSHMESDAGSDVDFELTGRVAHGHGGGYQSPDDSDDERLQD